MRADYRPDIDGLRAVAVLSVLFFHYGGTWLPGGFVGVDVFFVISGYLITKHLAEDINKHGYAIGPLLLRFYDRRIRRIVPALVVVLATTLAAGWFLLMPGDYASTGKSAAYSAFGLGNLYFYWNTGYFDREAGLQTLLHTWSLGVEEQFYLVWPVLLAVIIWAARGRRIVVPAVVAALVAIGLIYSVYTVAVDPKGAFYLPLPRAWELGAGALLAFMPAIKTRPLSELLGLAGITAIGWSLFTLTSSEVALGFSMVPAILGSAMIIWPRTDNTVARLLASSPMRFTGLISYSLYLWHWPTLVFWRYYANGEMPGGGQAIMLGVGAYVVAFLSWRFVETPARKSWFPPVTMISAGLSAATLVLAVGQHVFERQGFPARVSPEVAGMRSLEVMWEWKCPTGLKLGESTPVYCVFGIPWEKARTRAILWGDSHADHMAPLIEAAAKGQQASFLLYTPCPAALGGHVKREWSEMPQYVQLCADQMRRGIELLESDPSIKLVILSASWAYLPAIVSGDESLQPMSGIDLVKRGITDLIEATARPGRTFLLIGSVPQNDTDPIPCAVRDQLGLFRAGCSIDLPHHQKDVTERVVRPVDKMIKEIAASRSDVTAILPSEKLCSGDSCLMYLDGQFLYRDGSHLRRNLAERTRRDLADLIGITAYLRDRWSPTPTTAKQPGSPSIGQ